MTISILLSCMHQKDAFIVKRSNINTDVVVVNQCDNTDVVQFTDTSVDGKPFIVKMVNTTERGLSRSRNMAISHAESDICLISDDDEVLVSDVVDRVVKAYEEHPEADIITFKVEGSHGSKKSYAQKVSLIGYLNALHVSSVQISFRRESIVNNGILFDPEMGAGTGHGCGEENKFLYDCLHKHLRIIHVPITIASLVSGGESHWFNGWTKRFFIERGWATARYLGKPLAAVYAIYYAIAKRKQYGCDISMTNALMGMFKGICKKNI